MRIPIGLKLLALFFFFGAVMCLLTVALLLFPGSWLDALWRLNPEAHGRFQGLGDWAVLLMLVVGTACALAGVGLARNRRWGKKLALVILCVNFLGDSTNAIVRHDYRTLIGLPIAGALIAYLFCQLQRD